MNFVKKLYAFLIIAFISNTLFSQTNSSISPRLKLNFNPGWKTIIGEQTGAEAIDFNDSGWKNVTLPNAFNEDEAFKKDIHHLTDTIIWYRKSFKIPADQNGKKVFLEFEGVRQAGEFYLNGQFLGRHENGVMAFGFDISSLIKPAPEVNILAARIDNAWDYKEKSSNSRYQWNDKNFNANYGGIPKNVHIHFTDKLYQTLPLYTPLNTTGVYIYAKDFNIAGRAATITAESEVRNEFGVPKKFEYEVIIEDLDGKEIKKFSGGETTLAAGETKIVKASAKVSQLNFWSWGYGYLYNVHTILKVDGKPVDVVKTRTGFRKTEFANGMVKLNDRVIQMKGYAQRSSNEWPAVGISISPWVSDFSNRLMVESNANLVRWMHITPTKQDIESCDRVGLIQAMPAGDSEKDTDGRRWEHRVEVMRDAIVYNRNNPSILFYESGNAGISEEHMKEMKALRNKFDPHGGRAAGSRNMLDSREAEYGGEMLYVNKSARAPFWEMEYSRDEGMRKFWDNYSPPYHKDSPAYNRNRDSHAVENVVRWYDFWRERPGRGKRVNSGGVNIIFTDSNTHFRGDENYRRSGEADAVRLPKDGYYAHQVMWDGWVDVEKFRLHIIGHWNYEPGVKKNIYVVSSSSKVELFVNGASMGFGERSYDFLYTFKNIEWKPGVISAIGYDDKGKKLCENQIKTAGTPYTIKLTSFTSPTGFQANGSDLALVDVEVVDAEGQRCPTALNMINFTLDGPAEWRGGIAQGPGNYILSKDLPVECGVNRVIIRSQTKDGQITLVAKAEGLKPSTLTLTSNPVEVKEGISIVAPDNGLKPYLGRGPSLLTPSFTVSRVPVNIVSASAGSNAEKATQSFDDNEITSWSNSGDLTKGWISYQLDRSAPISEVVMKMSGWRNRTYPIKITIDGKVAFSDTTRRNLGYFTASFPPQTGKNLKIELIGINTEKDAYNIVEITGKKDDAGALTEENKSKGTLNIIEIEIYEKPKKK